MPHKCFVMLSKHDYGFEYLNAFLFKKIKFCFNSQLG